MSRKAIQRLAVAFATAIALVTGFSAALTGPPDTGWERQAESVVDAPQTGWQNTDVSTNGTGWQRGTTLSTNATGWQ